MSNASTSAIGPFSRYGHIAAAVMVSLMASTPVSLTAQAGPRERAAIGIGLGVVGGLAVLDAISKSNGKSRDGATTRSRKKYSGRNERTKRASRDDEDRVQRKKYSSKRTVRADESPSRSKNDRKVPTKETVTSSIDEKPSPVSGGKAAISTTEEITMAQEHLRFLGYEVGTTPGVLDVTTKTAIMKFQDSIKAETTGVLTVEQLQQMFALAAQRTAAKP